MESNESPCPSERPLPRLLSLTTERVLRSCRRFKSESGLPTLFIASYPKSGTTWLQCVLYHLLTRGDRPLPETHEHISDFTPFYEIENTWSFAGEGEGETARLRASVQARHEDTLRWHVFNTHLPFRCLPPPGHLGERYKYIYIVRDGKDVATSFFHHLSNQLDADRYTAPFSSFLREFLAGALPYGPWVEHVHDYLLSSKEHGEDVLVLQYERLVENLPREISKIARFLEIPCDEELSKKIAQFSSFEYMKANKKSFAPVSVPWAPGFEFIRKGQPGDHAQMFSDEDKQNFKEEIEKSMRRAGISLKDLLLDDGMCII